MYRKSLLAVVLGASLALWAAAFAFAEAPTTIKSGNLILTFNGGVTPKALPKSTLAPISLNVSGTIATADHSQPPPIKEIVVDTDKNGTIDALGVPTCTQAELEATTTQEAEKACRPAIVGTGTTGVEVAFPEQAPIPIHSKLIAFNGGVSGGVTTIYVHAYLTVPIPAAIVTTVKITKEHDGPYGTHSIASVPVIAGGSGSVTSFNLTFQKKLFSYKGKKHGYLLAKCANGHFLAQAETVFRDGSKVKGKIARACTPKG